MGVAVLDDGIKVFQYLADLQRGVALFDAVALFGPTCNILTQDGVLLSQFLTLRHRFAKRYAGIVKAVSQFVNHPTISGRKERGGLASCVNKLLSGHAWL